LILKSGRLGKQPRNIRSTVGQKSRILKNELTRILKLAIQPLQITESFVGSSRQKKEAANNKREVTKIEFDAAKENYTNILKQYTALVSSIGGISVKNRETLGEIIEGIVKGMGYLCFCLGNIAGSFLMFKAEFNPDSPAFCLRLVEFLAPALEASAVAKVRTTQDISFLDSEEYNTDINCLNVILEKRPEQLDQTVPATANLVFEAIDKLEGNKEEKVTIEVPVERKARRRF